MKTFITKITLQGFKSFNKRISIPLLPGLNVIAGPNGSGKSNLVDAVVFVIGKISAKSLRADRLHELIFHGGGEKNPAEYASVTLFLDNSQKNFPFPDEEISVTRKVNRRGVSVYKLNGRTTTREKVLQVLGAARIRPDGYNIVLQGDVTQIIEMNPIERRYVLDEISGIAEYNDKKEKAQRDLEAVDQKLKEAEIIITQRYDIFKKLEEERNAAIRFQTLQRQLTVLKASYAHKRLKTFEEDMAKIQEKIKTREEENLKVNKELEETESELDRREVAIREIANKVVDISKKVKIEKEVSELRAKIMIARDRIAANESQVERLDNLIDKLQAIESRKEEFYGEIPRAVRAVLGLKLKGVRGTVSSLISVPDKYRIAIEVAAGPHLNNIVVDDDDVASFCIDYLKKEKIGRATFLPLNKIKPNLFKDNELLGKRGVVGVASKLIKFDTKYMSAMEFVFGNTLVLENFEAAKIIGIGKARMVTLDGDLAERSGAIVGGYYAKSPKFAEAATKIDLEKYSEARKELEQETNMLKDGLEDLEKKLAGYSLSESAREFIDLEKMRVGSEREVDELRENRKRLHERKVNIEIELNRLKIDRAKLETEAEIARNEVGQYGEVEYLDEKLHTLQSHIRKTEQELATIGPVNMKAIEEFEKFKSEFDVYKQKYEKILEEKKAVIDMINEIEVKRKETFNKTLEIVAREFNNIFVKMAKGTAELELENSEDIESGLIIKARPRGKMLLNIDSMSGGEKTLTAMAFLFAIQRYHAAPFYIFDEVDAALDKENSRQIGQLMKLESRESQFILITHNDETIKYGDRVYGVTMDRGESKILGLELPKE